MVTTHLENPDNLPEEIQIDQGEGTTPINLYGDDVSKNTPKMLQTISYMWLALVAASVILVFRRDPDPDEGKDWIMDITEKEEK